MKQKLMYVELKTGYEDNGPAWIGMASFSKTGQTVYFNGLIFLKGERHSGGNHLEYFTGDSYWISGIKKTGEDRHWAGSGKIKIDKQIVEQYLETTKLSKLPSDKFDLVDFENNQPIQEFNILENKKLETF
nr:hypothetical protein [Mucilaginibacter sp. L294]